MPECIFKLLHHIKVENMLHDERRSMHCILCNNRNAAAERLSSVDFQLANILDE